MSKMVSEELGRPCPVGFPVDGSTADNKGRAPGNETHKLERTGLLIELDNDGAVELIVSRDEAGDGVKIRCIPLHYLNKVGVAPDGGWTGLCGFLLVSAADWGITLRREVTLAGVGTSAFEAQKIGFLSVNRHARTDDRHYIHQLVDGFDIVHRHAPNGPGPRIPAMCTPCERLEWIGLDSIVSELRALGPTTTCMQASCTVC